MSLKFVTGMKPKLLLTNEVNEIEQKNSFAIVYYCGILLTTFEYHTRLLFSLEYCLIQIKCLFIFIQNIQNWWRVGLRLKIGFFEHKMPLRFIMFATVHAKWPKLVPQLVKPEIVFYSQKQILFNTQNVNLILISYHTVS